ncbi:MAG: ABC transporter substrate-binding protein, partial [bacterium]
MKVFFRISAVLIMAFLLASCQFKVPYDPYTINLHMLAEPRTLNPLTSTDAYAGSINRYIYETLLETDNQTLGSKPLLAERWTISKDGMQFTFYLRKNVYWQDGVKFTAEDVLYSYNQIMNPKVDAARLRNYYRDVKMCEKLDDYTIRFTYKEPYFRALIMLGAIQIIPKHLFDDGTEFNSHRLSRAPIGTGPYKFLEWKTGREIVLVRDEKYWRK